MNVKPLFPTPVAYFYNFITEKERLRISESIENNKTSHLPHLAIDGDGSSTHIPLLSAKGVPQGGSPPNIIDNNIKKRLQTAVDEYVKMYGLQPVYVSTIWSNIQNVGSRLIEHRHAGSIVSGALYINVGDECKLYFHNPNPYIYSSQYAERTDYNYEFQWLKVENGQLVLFPSWLKHGKYSEIIKMDERMVVSFNCKIL